MRGVVLRVICICVLLSCSAACLSAEQDPRLARTVTIQCTDVRLHTALEKITKQTGVTIRCGSDPTDWRVRDIPVQVCANRLPLGTLLRAIATATHLDLTSSKGKNELTYRIWRGGRLGRELKGYEANYRQWGHDYVVWQWDSAAKLKDVPAPVFGEIGLCNKNKLLAASGILAALGPEARDKVIAGEKLNLSVQNASVDLQPLLENYLRVVNGEYVAIRGRVGKGQQKPTDDEFRKAAVAIRCYPGDELQSPSLHLSCEGVKGDQLSLQDMNGIARSVGDALPEKPTEPELRALEDEPDAKLFQTEIKLELPKDKDPDWPTFGDACAAIAKATGYSVIAEDFHSQLKSYNGSGYVTTGRRVFDQFRAPATLSAVNFDTRQVWCADESKKILYCTERKWRNAHGCLVPAKLIDPLVRKASAEGVALEDVLPLMSLTEPQVQEWVNGTVYMNRFCFHCTVGSYRIVWAFYDSLTPDQKKQAKTATGVRLYRYDLERLITASVEREALAKLRSRPEADVKWWEQTEGTDPVTEVVLRLKTEPAPENKVKYSLEISGKRGQTPFTATVTFGQTFPVYSEKREQELHKAQAPAKPD